MDDRTFDRQTALDWIGSVEKPGKTLRDEDIYPKLGGWLKRVSPITILDIGCGQGICSDKIDLQGRSYTGVEPSPFLVERARELYSREGRTFLQGTAYSLPLPDGGQDAAFSVLVWHLLSDLRKAAQELSRVLKRDGQFLIITANPDAYPAWKSLYPDVKLDGKRLEGTMRLSETVMSRDVLHLHSQEELLDSLQAAGLSVRTMETFRPAKNFEGQNLFISLQGEAENPGGLPG